MERRTMLLGTLGMLALAATGGEVPAAERKPSGAKLFERDNLIAWCIVPFDAKHRNPEERAELLQRLGFKHFAYDWRAEHIPTWDRELDALQKHGVGLDAFWFPCGLEPEKDASVRTVLDFLARRKVKTQLWLSLGMKEEGTQEERVQAAARAIGWVADEAAKIGCSVGLYNHGGWFGEPENQLAIIEVVKRPNVGIVYNFHHGHPHLSRFPELFRKMEPHLLAVNINGMRTDGTKILGVGKGDRELEMLKLIRNSRFHGMVGILGHREDVDAELALRENLDGLEKLRPELK